MNSWQRLIDIERRTRPYLEANGGPKAARFRVENKAGLEAEFFIYGEIGGPWGIRAEEIGKALRAVSPAPVTLRVHSEGGSAFEAVAIHSLLRNYPGVVDVQIDGLAASAGSIVAAAGDYVGISPGGQVFIHDAQAMTLGDAEDHLFMANLLNVTSETIASLYARRTDMDSATWRERMLANNGNGSWYNAEQALDVGLVDEILEPSKDGELVAAQIGAGMVAGMAQARQDRRELVGALAAGVVVGITRGSIAGIRAGIESWASERAEPRPRRWKRATGEAFGGASLRS